MSTTSTSAIPYESQSGNVGYRAIELDDEISPDVYLKAQTMYCDWVLSKFDNL